MRFNSMGSRCDSIFVTLAAGWVSGSTPGYTCDNTESGHARERGHPGFLN